jgi:hypothetical protein
LPQGLPKKIELQLLLADLALKLLDTLARRRKIAPHRLKVANPKALARPVGRPQRFRPTPPEVLAPFIKMPTRHPKLMAQLRRSLPGHHPLHNRQLELPPVDTSLPSGHRSPRQNCPLLSCLTSGVHSTCSGLYFACCLACFAGCRVAAHTPEDAYFVRKFSWFRRHPAAGGESRACIFVDIYKQMLQRSTKPGRKAVR